VAEEEEEEEEEEAEEEEAEHERPSSLLSREMQATFKVDSKDNNLRISGKTVSSKAACKRFKINRGASMCNVLTALENRSLKIKKLSSTNEMDGLCRTGGAPADDDDDDDDSVPPCIAPIVLLWPVTSLCPVSCALPCFPCWWYPSTTAMSTAVV
jgi:hypothetical protein